MVPVFPLTADRVLGPASATPFFEDSLLYLLTTFQLSATQFPEGPKWGTELETVRAEMEYKSTINGIDQYQKLGDEMKIGKAEIIGLRYGFRENKFCAVFITVKGHLNFTYLRDATFEKFGPPTNRESEKMQDAYVWLNDPTGRIRLAYIRPPIDMGVVEIESKHFSKPQAGF
jgi:hypothetical protein